MGFELTTIPASEVRDPRRTIPRAIITGIIVVTVFYLLTNFVVFSVVNWNDLSQTKTPLVAVGVVILGSAGAYLMSIGALISVSGSDESDMLATARLSYAMSSEGLFPRSFSRLHGRFGTPYIALIVQGLLAFGLSLFSGIRNLISFSVFNLAFAFLLTCVALIVLRRRSGRRVLPQIVLSWLGIAVCLFLLYSTPGRDKIIGAAIVAAGGLLYVFFSPKVRLHDVREAILHEPAVLKRAIERERRFLGAGLRIMAHAVRRLRRPARP